MVTQDDLIGQTLGQYQILDELGRGGMAMVYKAWQPSLRRYVAIKVMLSSWLNDREFVQRFQQEAIVAANLNHPNIVTIYEVTQQEGHFFIAMEYVEGQSLEELILSEGRLDMERVIHILSQVADALDYAHKRKFVHRDIKPANILITPEDKVVISDFGIAKALEGSGATAKLTSAGTVVGSPAYMSPEQIIGQNIDYRTDLYSLGIVTYEMLSGHAPFDGSTTALLYAQVNTSPPSVAQLTPDLPSHVEPCLMRMLVKQPQQRYPTATAFVEALEKGDAQAAAAFQQGKTAVAPVSPWNGTEVLPANADAYPSAQETGGYGTGPPSAPPENVHPVAGAPPFAQMTGEPAEKRKPTVIIAALMALGILLLGGAVAVYFLFLRPPNITALLEEAHTHQNSEEYTKAIEIYRDILEEDRNLEALQGMGSVYAEQGQWRQAADWYEKWTQEVPDDVEARLALGEAYYALEEYVGAVEQFERVIELDSERLEVYELLGWSHYHLGDYAEAAESFTRALEAEETAEIYRGLAASFYRLEDYEPALESYQAAVDLDPQDANSQRHVGWSFFYLQRYEEAVPAFSKALEIKETAEAYKGLAGSFYRLEDYESALEAYREVVGLDPQDVYSQGQIGWSLFYLQRYGEAIRAFSKALDMEETANAYRGLAASFYRLEDYESALGAYREAVALDPKDANSQKQIGWSLFYLQRYEEAVTAFSKALELEETAGTYRGLAGSFYLLEDYESALEAYQTFSTLEPDDAHAHARIGWCYVYLDDCENAKISFQRALEINADMESAEEGLRRCP